MKRPDFSRLWLVSFADSHLSDPLRRLRRQALHFGFDEDHILTMNENDLAADFREKMRDHLIPGSRGYGYWCWRGQVVLQAFDKMRDGDILTFLDAGCHLNHRGRARFADFVEFADKQGILGFIPRYPDQSETDPYEGGTDRKWTKGDLLDFFGVRDNRAVTETGQVSGGIFLAKKCPEAIAFFTRMRQIATEHFHLIDDSPSISPGLPGFIENRHDQSLMSLMYKTAGYHSISFFENWPPRRGYDPKNFPNDIRLGKAFFDNIKNQPFHSWSDKATGIKQIIPIRLRYFLNQLKTKLRCK